VAILGAQRGSFGRATLFDIREPVAEHAHPHVHLLFKLGGSDRGIEVGDEPLILGDDNCLLISPWQRHADLAEHCADTTMLALYLEPSYLAARYGTLPIPLFATASGELPPAGHSLVAEIGELLGAQADPTGRLEAAILALVDVALPRSVPPGHRAAPYGFRLSHPPRHGAAARASAPPSRFRQRREQRRALAVTLFRAVQELLGHRANDVCGRSRARGGDRHAGAVRSADRGYFRPAGVRGPVQLLAVLQGSSRFPAGHAAPRRPTPLATHITENRTLG
jgi:hypothetical protein